MLTNVFKETLRLLSPVPAIARRVTSETRLGDVVLPKDAEVMFPAVAIQRDPAVWASPDEFRPERWETKIEPGSWLPFSDGPRQCLGQHYARIFFCVGLAAVVRDFDFAPAPGYVHKLAFTGFGCTPVDASSASRA